MINDVADVCTERDRVCVCVRERERERERWRGRGRGWAATSLRQSFGLVAGSSITLTDSRSSESQDDYFDDVATSEKLRNGETYSYFATIRYTCIIHNICAFSLSRFWLKFFYISVKFV